MATPASGRRETLIILLAEAAEQLTDRLVGRLAKAGYSDVRAVHRWVFAYVDAEGTRLTELAAHAGMTHPSMSELVSGLVRAGYLERVPAPSDGRASLVCLSPSGRRMQRLALAEIDDIESAWLRELGPKLAREFPAALASAVKRWRQMDQRSLVPEPKTTRTHSARRAAKSNRIANLSGATRKDSPRPRRRVR